MLEALVATLFYFIFGVAALAVSAVLVYVMQVLVMLLVCLYAAALIKIDKFKERRKQRD